MIEPSLGGKALVCAGDGCTGRIAPTAALAAAARTVGFAGLVCAALAAAACGDADGPLDGQSAAGTALSGAVSAENGGAGTPAGASPSSGGGAADAERAALLARGEILSFSCRPCHGLAPGDESPVGPHLHGMFGRPAGQLDGFEYSATLRESGIVWSAETLDAWLAQPEAFLPGNDMQFAGFRSAEDRRALIEFLRTRTGADAAAEAGHDGGQASD